MGFGELQKECLQELCRLSMPTTREESFRFTDVSPIINSEPRKANDVLSVEAGDEKEVSFSPDERNRVVVFNGRIQWNLSQLDADLKEVVSDASQISSLGRLVGHLMNRSHS